MKKKIHLFLKKLIFAHFVLLSFVSCSFSWFDDFKAVIEKDSSISINFYVSNSEDKYFTRKYIIGTKITAEQLPGSNDKEVKALNPGFNLKKWKFYRNTNYQTSYPPYDMELDDENNIISFVVQFEDLDFYADCDYATDTPYTVEYYFQPVGGSSADLSTYVLDESYTKKLKGTTNSLTEAMEISVPGYNCVLPIEQKTINANGDTVVKVYMNRKTVTLKIVDPISSDISEISGQYGAVVEYSLPDRAGYKISGFINSKTGKLESKLPDSYPSEDLTFTIEWEEVDVDYTVVYYIQNLEDDEYTVYDTETLHGKAGSTTVADVIDITGFSANPFEQKTIESNGSTVVEIKYDRIKYSIIFNLNGGNYDGNGASIKFTVKYEGTVSGSDIEKLTNSNPVKNNSTFIGWSTSESAVDGIAFIDIPLENIKDDVLYYAIWKGVTEPQISITFPTVSENQSIEIDAGLSSDGKYIVATAQEGFVSYKWFFDGVYDSSSTSHIYNRTVPSRTGKYEVMVIATDDKGNIYTESFIITISKDMAGV